MTELKTDVFAGAQRRQRYEERPAVPATRAAGLASGPGEVATVTSAGAPGTDLEPFRTPPEQEARSSAWRAFLAKLGRSGLGADAVADRENERVIRQATWTRAMGVIVVNPKGASCKTPAAIITAGVLAQVRGGYVAAWEASEAPGDLADRAEGHPVRGLTELLAASSMVTSAGNLAGYTAPQTSHAAVIGTVSARAALSPRDVLTVRGLLDAYYHLTIADTGNNVQSPTFLTALDTADAVLVPCTLNLQSLRGLQRAMSTLEQRTAEHLQGITSRVVVVVSHDGGPEDPELAATAVETIRKRYNPRAVVEVPFDLAIRRDGEITLANLSPTSQRAWRAVARHLVDALQQAPEPSPIPGHPASAVPQSNTPEGS